MSFKEVKELRKAGNLTEALDVAKNDLKNNPDDIWNKRSIVWVYYEYLKNNTSANQVDDFITYLNKIKELQLAEDEKMVFDSVSFQIGKLIFSLLKQANLNISIIENIFNIIKDFHFTKPSDGYSFLNKAFHKAFKETNKYIKYMDWWNLNYFKPEDYLQEELPNGRKMMAFVEQVYINYSKQLINNSSNSTFSNNEIKPLIDTEKITNFIKKIDILSTNHPEYQYPPYFHAKLLVAIGDKENILSTVLPFAKKKMNDFWIWEIIANTFDKDDAKYFACLCKALSLKTQETFLVGIRQKMAAAFIKRELYNEAKTEIIKLIKVRENQKWRIPLEIQSWTSESWYIDANLNDNNSKIYNQYKTAADELLFINDPEDIIAVEFVNKNKKMISFVIDKNEKGFFNYENLIKNPKIGDVYRVRLKKIGNEGYNKLLTAKKEEDISLCTSIKTFEGEITIHEKGFGFVKDYFVNNTIINEQNIKDKQLIKGKALLSYNKRKEKWDWKVFEVLKLI